MLIMLKMLLEEDKNLDITVIEDHIKESDIISDFDYCQLVNCLVYYLIKYHFRTCFLTLSGNTEDLMSLKLRDIL